MKRFIGRVILLALFVVMAVMALVLLDAWVSKEPQLSHLLISVRSLLHKEWFAVLVVALVYFTAFLFARWHLIALPIRLDLFSEIDILRLDLDMELARDPAKRPQIDALKGMLDRAAGDLKSIGPFDRILWTHGQELACVGRLNEVEFEFSVIQSPGRVRARLETAEEDLREIPTKGAAAMADLIHKELAGDPSEDRIRSLLSEALGAVSAHYYEDFDDSLNWHNKTVWLTFFGILLVISLEGAKRGGGALFALGAVGGFLGRLMRALKQDDIPTGVGAYWTTLFMSPLVGALAGWTGILLVELAVKIGALGTMFAGVGVENGYEGWILGLAFALGFSERLFDEILKGTEDKIAKSAEASSSSSSSSSDDSSSSSGSPSSSSGRSSRSSSPSSSSGSSSSGSGSSSSSLGSSSSSSDDSSSSSGSS